MMIVAPFVALIASQNESLVELHRVLIDVRGNIVLGSDNYYEQEPRWSDSHVNYGAD